MIRTVYLIVLFYFLLGGIGFYFIGRKKEPGEAHKNYIKLVTYFLIINVLFFSIVIYPLIFRFFAILIIIAGFYEIFKLFSASGYNRKGFFLFSVMLLGLCSFYFFRFTGMDKGLILFSFLILSIFDSFSQVTGQLWGRKKIFPKISPHKTAGGLIGGIFVALLTALLIKGLIDVPSSKALRFATGVVVSAFAGDLLTSYYKRTYNVKDFSSLIPGHGGFLDRFDSLIAGGSWVAFSTYFMNF